MSSSSLKSRYIEQEDEDGVKKKYLLYDKHDRMFNGIQNLIKYFTVPLTIIVLIFRQFFIRTKEI